MRCQGVLYSEPKWDGYRAVAIRDDHGATFWSRQGKELTRYSVGVKRQRADLGLVRVPLSVRDRCRSLPDHVGFIPDHHDGLPAVKQPELAKETATFRDCGR